MLYANQQALSYYGQRITPRVDGTTLGLELAWTDQPDLGPPSWLPYEALTVSSKLYGEQRFRRVGEEWGQPHYEGRIWFAVHLDFAGSSGKPGTYEVRYFADLVVEGGSPASLV